MRKSIDQKVKEIRANLRAEDLRNLYQATRFLNLETRSRIGLRVPCTIYVQDPSTTGKKGIGLQEVDLRWEPALGDGPTSARLAVVDYDGDTGILRPPARWDAGSFSFLTADNKPVKKAAAARSPQFLQVNAWATVQRVIEYYEDPRLLGRPIPWAFEGNRLMIVPQAGFRNNAFYDRRSKSLQLYYFGDPAKPSYTCLSHDILAHETGHALLDGIRPYFLENSSWETAAFHEFIGDMTAILMAFRNNGVRHFQKEHSGVDLSQANIIAGVAEEFGRFVENRESLRTGINSMTFSEAQTVRVAHLASEMLTGTMFEILINMTPRYLSAERQAERKEPATPGNVLWWAVERMGRTALQALDLLPPVDVRFLDYARAVLRSDEISDPEDLHKYRDLIREVFHKRGLCPHPIAACQEKPADCLLSWDHPPRLDIFHDPASAARSRTAAYHLLHDNRGLFDIPVEQDFVVADVYDCNKLGPAVERLPRQIVIEYVWREDVKLEEERFGSLRGETVHLLCGGTVVFDDCGNLLWWTSKPGRGSRKRPEEGAQRRAELLDHIERIIVERRLTLTEDPEGYVVTGHPAAVVARRVGGALRLETAPHLCGAKEHEEETEEWTTSF